MNKADKAMSDIDMAASPSGPSSPNNPDQASGFIPNINVYGSTTPKSMAQDVTTAISKEDCWGDPVAQQVKMSNEQQLAFRCKAFNAARPNTDTTLPAFEAGEVEDY